MRRSVFRPVRLVLIGTASFLAVTGARCDDAAREGSAGPMGAGQQAYLAHCAGCHGDHGRGDGPLAGALAENFGEAPARLDVYSRAASLSRAEIRDVIARGGAHTGRSNLMPAWGQTLEPDVIEAITDYLAALGSGPEGARAQVENYMKPPPGASEDGRRLYVYYCSACHGPHGRGDGPVSETLRGEVAPRDLTDPAYFDRLTDRDIYSAISLGGSHAGPSVAMPGWSYELSPEQIATLVTYIRAISGTSRVH